MSDTTDERFLPMERAGAARVKMWHVTPDGITTRDGHGRRVLFTPQCSTPAEDNLCAAAPVLLAALEEFFSAYPESKQHGWAWMAARRARRIAYGLPVAPV